MTRFAVLVFVLALTAAGAAAPRVAADRTACLIIDTDAGVDDFRALAALLPARDVRAVVVTEGVSTVANGATAVSVLAGRNRVLPGFASPTPPAYDWLPPVRAAAERLNNYLAAPVPFEDGDLARSVLASVRGCGRVDVLVLGPWTSFPRYAPALGRAHIVASGRSFAENNPDNFNCEYDLAACEHAPRGTVYVDLPAAPAYDPTAEMVARFEPAGLSGQLRAVLDADPSQWLGTRLWDDAAALYLLTPDAFVPDGRHLTPSVSEDELRDLLVTAVNRG